MGHTNEVVIGTKGCTINDVIKAFKTSVVHEDLVKDKAGLIVMFNLERCSPEDLGNTFSGIMSFVLRKWKGQYSENATLEELIRILANDNFIDIVDRLKDAFKALLKSDQESNTQKKPITSCSVPNPMKSTQTLDRQDVGSDNYLRQINQDPETQTVSTKRGNNATSPLFPARSDNNNLGSLDGANTNNNAEIPSIVNNRNPGRGHSWFFNRGSCHSRVLLYIQNHPILFICGGSVLIVGAILLGILVVIFNTNVEKPPKGNVVVDLTKNVTNTTGSNETEFAVINNYTKYNQLVAYSLNKPIKSFKIYLNSSVDWPPGQTISSPTSVTNMTLLVKLSFQLTAIHFILQGSPNLLELKIIELQSSFNNVSFVDQIIPLDSPLYTFWNLKYLHFKNFSTEMGLALNISSSYEMPNLVQLNLTDVNIDENNVNFIAPIIGKLQTLKRLDIKAHILTDKPVFQHTMPNRYITEAYFDWKLNSTQRVYHFQSDDAYFCRSFNSLRILKARYGILPINDIILCTQLQELHISIEFNSIFSDLSSVKKDLKFLRAIWLYLYAEECPTSDNHYEIVQREFDKFKDGLDEVTFKSNCVIKLPDQKSIYFFPKT